MAKQAREVATATLTEKQAKRFHSEVFEQMDGIKSAHGKYMNTTKQKREHITSLHEGLTAFGISQKASKLWIKIVLMEERIKGLQADLEVEERKQLLKLAKAAGNKDQLSLLLPMPKPTKKEKAEKVPPTQGDLESTEAVGAA